MRELKTLEWKKWEWKTWHEKHKSINQSINHLFVPKHITRDLN